MLKALRNASVAALVAFSVAPSIATAHTYMFYDQYGHKHYTSSARYAEERNNRTYYQRHNTYVRDCGRSGTKGAVIGGIGGALVGQAIGHNTTGTVLGAGAGALAGHAIGKSNCERR